MRRSFLASLVVSCLAICLDSFACGAEIERLPTNKAPEKPSSEPAQIQFSFQVFEISRTKLQQTIHHPEQGSVLPDRRPDASWKVLAETALVDRVLGQVIPSTGRLLASPTLSVVDNQPMSFHSGSNVPILPSKETLGAPTEFVSFGTSINALPVLQADGSMKLHVELEIAELDQTLTATKDGRTIPGIRTRSLQADVVLKPDTTLVVGGMRQTRVESSRAGGLFSRKMKDAMNEMETVLVVKPTYGAPRIVATRR
jgi:hypothetical protein